MVELWRRRFATRIETISFQVIGYLNPTFGLGFDKLNPADTGWNFHQSYSTNEDGLIPVVE